MVMKKSLLTLAAVAALSTGAAFADRASVAATDGLTIYAQYDSRWPTQDDSRYWRDPWRDDGRQSVDDRQARMRDRIVRGFDDGRLTRREARMLERELDAIEAKERAFESDGRLSPRENAELHYDLDLLRERLRDDMRDGERRY